MIQCERMQVVKMQTAVRTAFPNFHHKGLDETLENYPSLSYR